VNLTLDAGALIALERGDGRVRALLRRVESHQLRIAIPAGVVGQTWRSGRQVHIARLLNAEHVEVVALDELDARAVGVLCGASGHADITDAHVALVARREQAPVVTSDPGDIRRVDPTLTLIEV
jgi:predicted nucleic acid-binding protein